MNLGIEDAFVFAELYHRGELYRYDQMRRPVIQKVVSQIQRAMAVPRAKTIPGRLVRTFPWLVQLLLPLVRARIQPWILGLDHEIEIDH
jgi:3-(3-hydroxy-phenyl)propionate hydroxylase